MRIIDNVAHVEKTRDKKTDAKIIVDESNVPIVDTMASF